ncbi:hypothetical protein D3C72_1924400 [compost metagenome]
MSAAAALMRGPIWVPSPMPSPTLKPRTAAASFSAKASWTLACTRMRLAQTQVWPALRYLEASAPATAASRSASSNTMKGALPPSSRESRFMVSAHWRISSLPMRVEPVKESLRTLGLRHSSSPTTEA